MIDKQFELSIEEEENKWILDQAKRSANLYQDPRYISLKQQIVELYEEYGVTMLSEYE